ncbi:FAD-dependent monooxygenase [Streptomyces sp. NPDC101206]|uniref:FAD-dependent monooxygenase n=1 Tax=Streptomyces sp. NPDC101206 TaxID=3366128 RepID=UPI00380BE922
MQADVAIVGGGPVGLLLAAELAGYGVDTVLLEARAEPSERPKATTLHARAVQSLARRGHLPPDASPYAGGSSPFHFAGLPGLVITAPPGEPEPVLKRPQVQLERHFERRAREAGATILRRHRVTGTGQDDDGVTVRAEGPQGPVTVTARYLVGADGARSAVREQAGIAADTHPATVAALAGTVRLREAGSLADGWHRTPRGWIVARTDAAGGTTHIRTLNCAAAHPDRRREPTLEELRREAAWIAGREIAMEDSRWLTRFSDFTRLARSFRAGRVLLVGDAAHVHFPIGGQGLSTGVQDALNLGWKLALAVRGAAGEGLLDTYDAERRPAARRVVDNTRAQLALMRPGPEPDSLREVFAGLLETDRDTGYLTGMISAQDTVLPARTGNSSPGEGTFLYNVALATPTGGTDLVALLQDGRPLLLLLGEDDADGGHLAEAREWAGLLQVVRARATPDVPYAALLVRPDGYVAWTPGGPGLGEALRAYVRRSAGGRAAAAPAAEAAAGSGRLS